MKGFPHLVWVWLNYWLNSLLMTRLFCLETQFYLGSHLIALECCVFLVKEQKWVWGRLRDIHLWSGLESMVVRLWQRGANDHCVCSGDQTTLDALCLWSHFRWTMLDKVALMIPHLRLWVEWLALRIRLMVGNVGTRNHVCWTVEPRIISSYLTCYSLPKPCSF